MLNAAATLVCRDAEALPSRQAQWDKEQAQKIQATLRMTIDELQDELTRKEVCGCASVCGSQRVKEPNRLAHDDVDRTSSSRSVSDRSESAVAPSSSRMSFGLETTRRAMLRTSTASSKPSSSAQSKRSARCESSASA